MSILDRMRAKYDDLKEAGVDLSAINNSIQVLAGAHDERQSSDPLFGVTSFPAIFDGEEITGAIRTNSIRLIEANRRPQEKEGWGSGTGDFFAVLELTLALEGAKLGVIEDDEFFELPCYSDPEFSGMTNQRPLFFGQILRANTDALAEFKALLDESEYLTRVMPEGQQQRDLSEVPAEMRETWSLESPNRQTGRYQVDLAERVHNGLDVSSFVVVPPRADQRRDEGFEDMIQSFHANLDRAAEGQDSEDEAERTRSRKLVSSLTGVTERLEGDEIRVYAQRATVPELTVVTQVGLRKYEAANFVFWANAPAAEAK